MRPVIAMLTDFGTLDPFVAIMKGVMRVICPNADFIDVTHDIEAQNVRQAAFTLLTSWRWFPPGTVFLCVVDPGVGSERRALLASAGGRHFVAPDNGLLSWTLADNPPDWIVSAENRAWQLEDVSHTFHGRDVFAPWRRIWPSALTLAKRPRHFRFEQLPEPLLEVQSEGLRAEVLHIDRFGNLVTSVGDCRWRENGTLLLSPRFGGGAHVNCRPTNCELAWAAAKSRGCTKPIAMSRRGSHWPASAAAGFWNWASTRAMRQRRWGFPSVTPSQWAGHATIPD